MKKYFFLVFIFISIDTFSQKDDNLKTEKITIIKSYSPEILNAQKESIFPKKDSISPKMQVKYNLYKLPNTYIYIPKKIEPLEIDFILNKKDSNQINFIGNAILGFANYWTIYGEFFIADSIDDTKSLGTNIRYFSVNGKNNSSNYNMNFKDIFVKSFYNQYFENYYLKSNIDYQENEISYYGVPEYIDPQIYSNLHPQDMDLTNNFKYITFKNLLSRYTKDTLSLFFFNSVNLNLEYTEDAFFSNEFNTNIKTSMRISIENILLGTDIEFENQYLTSTIKNETKNIHIGNFILNPYLIYKYQGFILNLGTNIYYNYDKYTNSTKFKIYPKFDLEYSPNSSIFTIFANLEGGYKLNRFSNISKINPWFSPLDLNVVPSDIIYNFSLGLKGNFIKDLNYKIGTSFIQTNDNLNFIPNIKFNENEKNKFPHIGFVVDNSFETIRLNTTLFELFFNTEYKISSTKEIGLRSSFFVANSDTLKYFYQPNLEIELYTNLVFIDKWQLSIFAKYIGNRHSMNTKKENNITYLYNNILEGFIDLNLYVNYRITNEFSVFLKLNNIINQKYQIYNNYNSLEIWLMGGISYRF